MPLHVLAVAWLALAPGAARAQGQAEAAVERALLLTALGRHDRARLEYAALAASDAAPAVRRFAVLEAARSSLAMGAADDAALILAEALAAGSGLGQDPDFQTRACAEAVALARAGARLPGALERACADCLGPPAAPPQAASPSPWPAGRADSSPEVRVLLARGPVLRLEVPAGTLLRAGGAARALPAGTLTLTLEGAAPGFALRGTWAGGALPCGAEAWLEPRGGLARLGQGLYGPRLRLVPLDGQVAAVQHVALETYLRGVVPAEMPAAWPAEAHKAQAVAARTYALAHRGAPGRSFDLYADERSQVYLGQGRAAPATDRAVLATRGQVLTHEGKPFAAYYHAHSGGWIEGAGSGMPGPAPVLAPGPDPAGALAPPMPWRVDVGQAELLAALARAGHRATRVLGLDVAEASPGGRARVFSVTSESGVLRLPAGRLRALLGPSGPRSLLCRVRPAAGGFTFIGQGFGHGVGMSQHGAAALARSGLGYQDILARYYRGARLERLPWPGADQATIQPQGEGT
ncbi:SpoIID/LytB domain-containing protein [Desulfocurvus vexinensis]|uniref:SpoIID/LytB domain-containing protein n=1 Tax=Desulfocurvus vexinensis TaxID=399548 RepID=UPI0004B509EB|nr:SpoIID/LytB domain-containing protein [Desulfocurvus vexinensis]